MWIQRTTYGGWIPIVSMTIASRMDDILFSKSREPGFQSPNGSTRGPYPELTFVITDTSPYGCNLERASSIVATSLNWAYAFILTMNAFIKRPLAGRVNKLQHTTCAEVDHIEVL